jgi:hypothetical protein
MSKNIQDDDQEAPDYISNDGNEEVKEDNKNNTKFELTI